MSPPFDLRDPSGWKGLWNFAQSPYGTDFNKDWEIIEKEMCRTVDLRKSPRKWTDYIVSEFASFLTNEGYHQGPTSEPVPPYIGQVFYVRGDREFVYWNGTAWKVLFMGRYPVAGQLSCSFSWVKKNVDLGSLVVTTPFFLPSASLDPASSFEAKVHPTGTGGGVSVPIYRNRKDNPAPIGHVTIPSRRVALSTPGAVWFAEGDVLTFGTNKWLSAQHIAITTPIYTEEPWPPHS